LQLIALAHRYGHLARACSALAEASHRPEVGLATASTGGIEALVELAAADSSSLTAAAVSAIVGFAVNEECRIECLKVLGLKTPHAASSGGSSPGENGSSVVPNDAMLRISTALHRWLPRDKEVALTAIDFMKKMSTVELGHEVP